MTNFDHAAALSFILERDAKDNRNPVTAGKVHLCHKPHDGCAKESEDRDGILVVCRTYENGSRNLWIQCSVCGTGRALRNALWPDLSTLPPWDEGVLNAASERGRATWQEERERLERERQAEREDWKRAYEEYLRTEEWRARRDKVMRRARWVCESCGESRAEAVHHTTYAHLGREPLWELRAVCHRCHEMIHSIDAKKARTS
jgi:hypothetical protein